LVEKINQRHQRDERAPCLAKGLRSLQRQRFPNGGRAVHQESNQKAHHERRQRRGFDEEFIEFLRKYPISSDPSHALG
jgi:hypothetical protein